MQRGDNSVLRGETPPDGMRLVESPAGAEMEAFDSLPPAVRRAIGESPFSMSSIDCLTAWLRGWSPADIVARIEEADQQLAHLNGTCPEAYRPGMPLQLRPRPGTRRSRR